MTTKAQLSKALADSFAYCDKVIAGMDDKKAHGDRSSSSPAG